MPQESNHAITIFIPSGAGAPGFAGILRCLQEEPRWRVLVGDTNADAYGKALADGFFLMPSSGDDAAYLAAIRRVCLEESVDVILPITTRELGVLSRHKDALAGEGIRVIVSGSTSIDIANDKGKSADFAQKLGLPVPQFRVARDLKEFQTGVSEMQLAGSKLCFKPVLGNGSRGFGIVVNEVVPGEFLQAKAGVLPMTLEEWSKRLGGEGLFDVPLMICDFLPGVEYSVDMLCSGGKTLFCVPRTRDKMIGGISVAGRLDRNFGLIAFCIQLAQALELDGPIGMQWREDAEGTPRLLEINPRLQGTTSALALAGINLPVQAVRLAMGEALSSVSADVAWGKKFVRFWDERVTE